MTAEKRLISIIFFEKEGLRIHPEALQKGRKGIYETCEGQNELICDVWILKKSQRDSMIE